MALGGENINSRPMKSFVNSGYKYQSSTLNADIISNISNVPKQPKVEQNITPTRGNSPGDNQDYDDGIEESIDLSSVNMQSMQLRQRPKANNYSQYQKKGTLRTDNSL